MPSLRFRLPGRARRLSEWLSLLLPSLDRAARRQLIEGGRVRVAKRPVDRAGFVCPPGAGVEIDAVDVGTAPHPPDQRSATWFVWADAPAIFGGEIAREPVPRTGSQTQRSPADGRGPRVLRFVVETQREGLARLAVEGDPCSAAEVLEAMRDAGLRVVGDLEGGGLGCPAGLAVSTSRTALDSWVPMEDPPWPVARDDDLVLRVSDEAARAVDRGHPWILADAASDAASAFRPGSELRIETRGGRVLGWGWAEGDEVVAARMAVTGDVRRREIPSIEARIARALGRRRGLFAGSASDRPTDCFRLVHGEGDDLPGLFIDRLGPLLRVLVTGRASDGFRARAIDALLSQMPMTEAGAPFSVLELIHLRGAAKGLRSDAVRWLAGGRAALAEAGVEWTGDGFWVVERGLRFAVDPGWHAPDRTRPGFGLFPDQRDNRERLAREAGQGGRWLNLFAHTGAFSVALLAAGADAVDSVDLSAPYLARLDANLVANTARGVDRARHRSVRGDGRRFVESLPKASRYAGIVLDPPTAAAAGRRFWSVKRDLEPLIRDCVARLEAEGVLLVTQNAQGSVLALDRLLERVASRAHRRVRSILPAGPSADHPTRVGFPQGDAFEGWLLRLDG